MKLTVVNCQHHQQGACSLGLFGGSPSAGVCRKCDQRQAADESRDATYELEQAEPSESTPVARGAPMRRSGGSGCGSCRRSG